RSHILRLFCFFFSSRRRHTRFSRDWSSDVCSSDLGRVMVLGFGLALGWGGVLSVGGAHPAMAQDEDRHEGYYYPAPQTTESYAEIGRASCRERVQVGGGGGAGMKKGRGVREDGGRV